MALSVIGCLKNLAYRKFPNRGAGRVGKPLGALSLERGQFHLPVAFYRLKIGPFLAEIWPETSRNPVGLGPKKGGGAPLYGVAPLLENLRYLNFRPQLFIS